MSGMTGRRRFYLAVVGWLSIVAVGSTLVWTVVAQAGRDVGEPERETLAASSGPEPSGSAPPTPTPSAGATDTGTAPAPESPTETTTAAPTEPATEAPGGSPSQSTGPPPAATHRRTWEGAAGRVTAQCAGARISLVAAQPHSGWRVEVDDRGPDELSVKFELTEEAEDDRVAARWTVRPLSEEVEVHARCVGGVPSFAVDG